jgi:hypothetical protein
MVWSIMDCFYQIPTNVMIGLDWIGSAGKRYYVDIRIVHPCVSDQPEITIEQLKAALPKIKRESGHSGELHTEEQEQKF